MNQPGVDLLPNTGSEYYIPKVRKYQQFSFTPPMDDVGLSNICYSEFKYSRSTSLGVFHPSGRMGKSL